MDGFFASGRAVDVVLAVMAIEFAALVARAPSGGRWAAAKTLFFALAPGACILLALRAALVDAGWQAIAVWLSLAFPHSHRRSVAEAPVTVETPAPAGIALRTLRLEEFFQGPSTASGMFEDRFGKVRRRMAIVLEGRMDGATLNLDERFTFDDGAREHRVWRITPVGAQGYTATADDMIGTAKGRLTPNGVAWSYLFSLQIGARRLPVRFAETFSLVSADTMINRARVTKFGVLIGCTTIVFRRVCA